MRRHRLFAAIVLSGLEVTRCGGTITPPADAAPEDAANERDDDGSFVFDDSPYEAASPDAADTEDVVDAFVHPPVITN
jgi:hypothetical protein